MAGAQERGVPVQGTQHGDHNEQWNYFAPVTQNYFTGASERLRDVCFDPAPLARDLDLAHFTGRGWLIEKIDGFIKTRPRGYVIIQAEAGVGKSTLAAHLVGTRSWLHHFSRLPGGRSPEAARKSLAAQLIAQWDLLGEWAPGGILPAAAGRVDWFARLLAAAARRRSEDGADEPIVLVIDGLDEAEAETPEGRGLPFGLPDSLPDGVFVLMTSRVGPSRALHAVRNPADWLTIEVEGADNLSDMSRFINEVTSPDGGDERLLEALARDGTDPAWFRREVARTCAGVWMYLRYILDEIRAGTRSPNSVADLPGDLASYYAEQAQRWRGNPDDESAALRWEQVRLPLLGVLAVARAPLTVLELTSFAGVPMTGAARAFIEETARAFLSRGWDGSCAEPCYAPRHQSLRDLLTGRVPAARPDLDNLARTFAAQARIAHRQITGALIPSGLPVERDWGGLGQYGRRHLAGHAAACGALDGLSGDPGFLLAVDPVTVLVERGSLRTQDGKRALEALELTRGDRGARPSPASVARLAANAARVRATALVAACAQRTDSDWPVRWAGWAGRGHRKLTGHNGWVKAVAIGRAADRDIIISGSFDRTVRIWDAITGEPIGTPLTGHGDEVQAVAIGRAGDRDIIVSGSDDGSIRTWDAATGEHLHTLVGHNYRVAAVAIGRAGNREVIVSGGSSDATVRIWDAITGEPIGIPIRMPTAGLDLRVNTVAIGRVGDRDIIISGSHDGNVWRWDATTGQLIGSALAGHVYAVDSVALGRAAKRDIVVSGSTDKTVRIWDAVTGEPIGDPLRGHENRVNAVAIGRSGSVDVIVSGSTDKTARIWDAVTGKPIGAPITGSDSWVNAVAIGRAGDRDVIITASLDWTVRMWDASDNDVVAGDPPSGHHGPVTAVAIGRAANRDIIITGSDDGTALTWDAATGEQLRTLVHKYSVTAVAIGRAGNRDIIITGSRDEKAWIWDAVTGSPVDSLLADGSGWVNAVAIGRAGNRDVIITGSNKRTVRIWDAATGAIAGVPLVVGALPADHRIPVTAVAIGRAGSRDIVVCGSGQRTVWLDGETGEAIRPWDANVGGTVQIWDAVTGEAVETRLAGRYGPVNAVAIGRIGTRDVVVSGSGDVTVPARDAYAGDAAVRIWDAITGEPVGIPFAGHNRAVNAVAIGRAGDRDIVISGSDDNTVRVWDAVSGAPSGAPLGGHDDRVTAVAIGRAGGRDVIVTASDDQTVLVYEYRPQ